ncbi:MAG TPA: zinc-binding dehydrogenase, partial [Deinococcales bacterium]|nr:zinc-binding dehydrogenase [Deinococcales bacterium]
RIEQPLTPGHELAGVVTGGSGEAYGLPDGTPVAIDPAQPCGQCEHCRRGYENLCPQVRFLGSPGVDGGLTQMLAVPAASLIPVPDGFTPATIALLEPLGVALHALDVTRLKPLESVTVLGAGPIGLLLAQVARVSGAGEVRVVEPVPHRRRLALRLGADSVHAHYGEVLDLTGGRGSDTVLEATNSPDGPEHACQVARIGGKVTLVGIPEGDTFTLNAGNARRKGLTIRMSRRMGRVWERAISLARDGRVDLEPIASHHEPLERAAEALETAARVPDGFVKAVIYPNGQRPRTL